MPRKLTAEMTLDSLQEEILFTRAALNADPDARDLLPQTSEWLPWVDTALASERTLRQAVANTDAERIVANQRLDLACTAFARELLFQVDHDRSSPRWTAYFSMAPSAFVQLPLAEQVDSVRGWLTASTEPALETHREVLTQWSSLADTALVNTRSLTSLRANQRLVREDLGGTLTAARDSLHRSLAQRAEERRLPREWSDVFFVRVTRAGTRSE